MVRLFDILFLWQFASVCLAQVGEPETEVENCLDPILTLAKQGICGGVTLTSNELSGLISDWDTAQCSDTSNYYQFLTCEVDGILGCINCETLTEDEIDFFRIDALLASAVCANARSGCAGTSGEQVIDDFCDFVEPTLQDVLNNTIPCSDAGGLQTLEYFSAFIVLSFLYMVN